MPVMNDEVVRADPVLRQPGMQRTICISFLGVIIAVALALLGLGSYALAVLWPR